MALLLSEIIVNCIFLENSFLSFVLDKIDSSLENVPLPTFWM